MTLYRQIISAIEAALSAAKPNLVMSLTAIYCMLDGAHSHLKIGGNTWRTNRMPAHGSAA